MSNKSILTALALALVLALVTVVIVLRGGTPSANTRNVPMGEPVLALLPSDVTAKSFTPAGKTRADTIIRDPARPGGWTITLAGAAAPWPVDPTRIRAVLDIVAGLRASGTTSETAALGESATLVEIKLQDGSRRTMRMATRTLGGQGIIEVATLPATGEASPGRLATVPDSVVNLFVNPGPRGWRDTSLLPGVGTTASRIRILTAAGTGLALGKVQGSWGVREPVAGMADAGSVQRLLSVLENLRLTRFHDDGAITAKDTALDTPTAQVVIESDTAGTPTRHLTIGARSDSTGASYFATIDEGQTIVSIGTEGINAIRPSVEEYLSGSATALAPADIAMLVFKGSLPPPAPPAGATPPTQPLPPTSAPIELGFRRSATTWVELAPGGKEVAQDPARLKQIDDMLAFLTSQRAAHLWLADPAGYVRIGTLTLSGAGGETLEELEVATAGPAALVLRSGKVLRGYTSVPDLLRGSIGALPPAGEVGPDGKPIEREIMK
ncbi:MAG: DUF4340 domain-containing protein [Phycisphaerales bacterium]